MYKTNAQTINLRLAFAIALALHFVVIVALEFVAPEPAPRKSLNVTFTVNTHQSREPTDANHIASQDQIASGTIASDLAPTTTEVANQQGETVQDTRQEARRNLNQSDTTLIVTTTAKKPQQTQPKPNETETPTTSDGQNERERQLAEIRALEARLALEQQAYAQRPKIHRFTSVAALAAVDAEYQKAWQEKVELTGNANYPQSAVEQGLNGDVTLKVALRPDGTVKSITIVKGSGYAVLDRSAISSVNLAKPFAPFPPSLAQKADILEIYRTWQFRQNQLVTIDG